MKGYGRWSRPAQASGDASDWRARAVCRGGDPELWFPVGTTGPALKQIEKAKTVCRRCPVVTECLTWAVDTGESDGVWGGMSEDERRQLKRMDTRRSSYRHTPAGRSETVFRSADESSAAEDLLRGSTIPEIRARYGLSKNRAEQLSVQVRRRETL